MPDENVEKKEGVDIAEALAAIEKTVSAKLDAGMSNLEKKLVKPEEKEEEPWEPESDDDTPLTRKEAAALFQKAKKENETANEVKTKKQMMDSRAMQEFPELNQASPHFMKKFHDEVSKEISQRVSRGRSADDVDLVYDCTAAVAARGNREGWLNQREKIQREAARRNATEDNFDGAGRGAQTSSEPSEEQTRFASTVGLTKEKLTQLLERVNRR